MISVLICAGHRNVGLFCWLPIFLFYRWHSAGWYWHWSPWKHGEGDNRFWTGVTVTLWRHQQLSCFHIHHPRLGYWQQRGRSSVCVRGVRWTDVNGDAKGRCRWGSLSLHALANYVHNIKQLKPQTSIFSWWAGSWFYTSDYSLHLKIQLKIGVLWISKCTNKNKF